LFVLGVDANADSQRMEGWNHQRSSESQPRNNIYTLVGKASWPAIPEHSGHRSRSGISAYVDRLRGLGNAVVPQVAEWIGRRIVEVWE
jgi:hypothetical protein